MIKKPRRKQLREFGIGLGSVLIVFALLAARKHRPVGPYLFGFGTVSLLFAVWLPSALEWVYRPWMRFAKVLAAVNTAVIMFLVFYFLITPYGIVSRLLGEDPLDERLGTGDSYWKPRTSESSCERQF